MLKLIIGTIIIILVSIGIIGYTNDTNKNNCYDMGGKPVLNNKGDIIGCVLK